MDRSSLAIPKAAVEGAALEIEVTRMRGVFGSGLIVRSAIALALSLAALVGLEGVARADGYPDRTVKIIVPFPAGGTADVLQ